MDNIIQIKDYKERKLAEKWSEWMKYALNVEFSPEELLEDEEEDEQDIPPYFRGPLGKVEDGEDVPMSPRYRPRKKKGDNK